jgi:indolepyruvate ferredoxin oxidoreductase alpha subunit
VAADTDMTLLILDNSAVAMTGGQESILPSGRMHDLVLGLGVPPEHCHLVDAHPRRVQENGEILRREIEHRGLSVIVAARECKEVARRKARAAAARASQEAGTSNGAGSRAEEVTA